MKRSSQNRNTWADHYTRKARKENYPARSVYKLQELQSRYKVIKSGDHVLDLGCAPGSWLLLAAKIVGNSGSVAGVDLTAITVKLPANTCFFQEDVYRLTEVRQVIARAPYQVVLSDMAPATSGNKIVDNAKSMGLCEMALYLSESLLVGGGNFVCKLFQGDDFQAFRQKMNQQFNRVVIFKPRSSRKTSREIFLVGQGKRE